MAENFDFGQVAKTVPAGGMAPPPGDLRGLTSGAPPGNFADPTGQQTGNVPAQPVWTPSVDGGSCARSGKKTWAGGSGHGGSANDSQGSSSWNSKGWTPVAERICRWCGLVGHERATCTTPLADSTTDCQGKRMNKVIQLMAHEGWSRPQSMREARYMEFISAVAEGIGQNQTVGAVQAFVTAHGLVLPPPPVPAPTDAPMGTADAGVPAQQAAVAAAAGAVPNVAETGSLASATAPNPNQDVRLGAKLPGMVHVHVPGAAAADRPAMGSQDEGGNPPRVNAPSASAGGSIGSGDPWQSALPSFSQSAVGDDASLPAGSGEPAPRAMEGAGGTQELLKQAFVKMRRLCPRAEEAERIQHCYSQVLIPISHKDGIVVFQGDAGGVCVQDVTMPTQNKKRSALTVAMSINVEVQVKDSSEEELTRAAWDAVTEHFPPLVETAIQHLKQQDTGMVDPPREPVLPSSVKEEEPLDDPMQGDEPTLGADAAAGGGSASADVEMKPGEASDDDREKQTASTAAAAASTGSTEAPAVSAGPGKKSGETVPEAEADGTSTAAPSAGAPLESIAGATGVAGSVPSGSNVVHALEESDSDFVPKRVPFDMSGYSDSFKYIIGTSKFKGRIGTALVLDPMPEYAEGAWNVPKSGKISCARGKGTEFEKVPPNPLCVVKGREPPATAHATQIIDLWNTAPYAVCDTDLFLTERPVGLPEIRFYLPVQPRSRDSGPVYYGTEPEYLRLLKGNMILLLVGLGAYGESGGRWVTLFFRCGTCSQTVRLDLELKFNSYEELGKFDFYQLLAEWEHIKCGSRHILGPTHWNVWTQRGERISAIMGLPRVAGAAVRHQTQINEVSPYGYFVDGVWVFSPSQQGCPLPTKECVARYLGRVPNLIPALVAALRMGCAKLEIRGETKKAKSTLIPVRLDDVESIRAELVLWDANKMHRQYDASSGSSYSWSGEVPKRVNCLPFDLLLDTDREYFLTIVGRTPSSNDWHPEIPLQQEARNKYEDGERLSPMEKKQVFWQAATEKEAWYPIVTAKPRRDTAFWNVSGGDGGSWCPVQIATPDGPSDASAGANATYVGWVAPGVPRVSEDDLAELFPEGSPWSRL